MVVEFAVQLDAHGFFLESSLAQKLLLKIIVAAVVVAVVVAVVAVVVAVVDAVHFSAENGHCQNNQRAVGHCCNNSNCSLIV